MNIYYILLILNNIILINCYSYLSTFEAYIKNSNEICLGDCRDVYGQKKCIYDWNAHETECKPLYIQTKKYKTIDNKVCTSNCGNFNNEPYQWCVVDNNGNWDYCTRLLATKGITTYRTRNKYITCTDECIDRKDNYGYWCHTLNGNWDYCYPNKKVLLFNYRRKDNTICATPCELYSNNVAYCYDKNENWNRCFLNPEYKNNLNVYHTNIKLRCRPGDYTSNGYKLCKKINKRDLSFTSCPLNVEEIARDYENNNPVTYVRDIDPNNIITTDVNPVISFAVLPTYSYFGNDQLNLPLVVRAIITTYTLRNPGERESFPAEIDHHFNNMNPNLNHVNYDERGHIIGSRLGGPTETYNIFPQSWIHNRGRNARWQYMEANLDTFIRNHPNRYAEYTAILSYQTNNNILDHRPTAIALRIRLYENGSLVDMRGNRITYNTNSLENMYYTNDPNYSCAIEGDEIEDK
ncbi:unknown similar to AMEV109 [Choristoneura rosaceana entomopoxvirus 'L']|uniref:Type VII secretion system protein EssD-like domain-containing protein n=1 Tax=Choristoneura rosaceana entomopoxvirus 'L' TaxID=1293539 RepID=A0ABM9QKH3_9POXV|nr:unknown similar to AMEV109 [Choristoneura rosaceana entomopoxvirus 'L']CCU56047.1 unknown similar to AMEV109 [Choristoneura rosaceana entomopoxvirus 'L']